MAIDPTAAANNSAAATGRTRMADSYETFMSLLTAQIKNQDPLSPMDSTQFTQQLVQMTGVEQQLLTNDLLEKLVTNTGSGIQTSVSLLGKEVRAAGDLAKLTAGKAEWNFKLGADAADVTVEVLDSAGKVVQIAKLSGDQLKAGEQTFAWNGKDRTGAQLANGGQYSLRITAIGERKAKAVFHNRGHERKEQRVSEVAKVLRVRKRLDVIIEHVVVAEKMHLIGIGRPVRKRIANAEDARQ